jgi:hypothetical protein
MTKATFVNFFHRSYQVLLTDVVIIPRWAIQAPGLIPDSIIQIMLPVPEAREISVSRCVPGPKQGNFVYPDIALHISWVTIVFILLKIRTWHTQYKCTKNLQGIKPGACIAHLGIITTSVNRSDVRSNFSVTWDWQNAWRWPASLLNFASQTCRCLQSPIFV